jgi:DNA repair exonuclease SbcCD nuclease subunit
MIRFLHIGDVHINKSFATKDEVLRHKLQRAVIKSFQNAVAYCISSGLDALMIAGDLFDSGHVSLKDGEIVRDAFEQLKKHDIKVFYASGNHDYTHYDSKIRQLSFPDNVITFFNDYPEIHELIDEDNNVYKVVGCGHMVQHENRNLIEQFPTGRYIGLAHAMVQSSITKGDEGDYLPSTIETISSKGYHYFGLGHIHQNGFIDKHETIFYSGVLQGLNSNEIGLKGGNIVVIKDNILDVKFVPLCSVIFDKIAVDVTDLTTMEKLLERMQVEIRGYGQEKELEQISLEITLIGRTKLFRKLQDNHEISDLKSILLEYHHLFDLKIKIAVKTTFDEQLLKGKSTVLGDVLKTISDMQKLPSLEYLSEETELEHIKDGLSEQVMDYFLEGYDED